MTKSIECNIPRSILSIIFLSFLFFLLFLLFLLLFYYFLLFSIIFYYFLFFSFLFFSILFFSILFYSILFYSFLFFSTILFFPSLPLCSILARWVRVSDVTRGLMPRKDCLGWAVFYPVTRRMSRDSVARFIRPTL